MIKDKLGHWWSADTCQRCGIHSWTEAAIWQCKMAKPGEIEVVDTPLDDVLKMVEMLQADRRYGPLAMYLPDSGIIAMGGDPDDYPELDGFPGVRVVEAK